MSIGHLARRFGNGLYTFAFPIYRPLYRAFKSYADRVERDLLARHLSAGCVVVDAGANIGIYSQFLSRCVGPDGLVHSFEPSPANFAHLREIVSQLSNVRPNQLAVGGTTGEAVLYVSDEMNVDHRTYSTHGERRDTLVVRSIRLDDYFAVGERVDLIKLDIQGYELHALQGAARVLDDNPEIKLLLEFWPYGLRQAGADWKELVLMLEKRGMTIQRVSKAGLKPLQPDKVSESSEWYVNLLALRA